MQKYRSVPTLQMPTIEALFNQDQSLTISEIVHQTQYSRTAVLKAVQALKKQSYIILLGTKICSVTGCLAVAYLRKGANE